MSQRPSYVPGGFFGKCKNFPVRDALLLPSQERWVKDTSRFKLAEKSRQIGWTWSTGYGLVRRKSLVGARLDAWISSRDDLQAKLFLEDLRHFGEVLNLGAVSEGERVIDAEGHSAYVLRFANGLRAHSMSSNPDAQAGKRGDRVLDEFALHPDPRKLYSIAYPGITWGGSLEIFSTHRGSANFFNELVNEARHKGNPKKFSLHRVTLEDALAEGFLYKLQTKLPEGDERMGMDETDYFNSIRAGCADAESFAQEYMCQPADDTTAFLSYDLIAACVMRGTDDLRAATEETRDHVGRKGKIRRLQNLTLREMADLPFDLYLGMDIARLRDLAVIWVSALMGGVMVPLAIVEMECVAWERQEAELYAFLGLPRLRRGCLDATGQGNQFAERAQIKFGRHRVEAVTFTPAVKAELAEPLRMAFEDRTARVPDDRQVIADHRAIKKEQTASGNVRFAADRGKDGHSDRFWAHGLCRHAAKAGEAAGDARAVKIPGRERLAGAGRRMPL